MKTVKHKFHKSPLPTWECETLILGTFNPEIGSNADYYYGRLRKTEGWSNRFWPAVNSYLKINYPDIQTSEPRDLDSKVRILTKFKFGCVDLISSVECVNLNDISRNGFSDVAIFHSLNKVIYNTEMIIDFINSQGIKKIISSFGKDTSLNNEFKNELNKIRIACPDTIFQLFDLPAFGRPMMSTNGFGIKLFHLIL